MIMKNLLLPICEDFNFWLLTAEPNALRVLQLLQEQLNLHVLCLCLHRYLKLIAVKR